MFLLIVLVEWCKTWIIGSDKDSFDSDDHAWNNPMDNEFDKDSDEGDYVTFTVLNLKERLRMKWKRIYKTWIRPEGMTLWPQENT